MRRPKQPAAPEEESKVTPNKRQKKSTAAEETSERSQKLATTSSTKNQPKKPQTAEKLVNLQVKGFATIKELNVDIDKADKEVARVENKLEALQSKHDDLRSFTPAERERID